MLRESYLVSGEEDSVRAGHTNRETGSNPISLDGVDSLQSNSEDIIFIDHTTQDLFDLLGLSVIERDFLARSLIVLCKMCGVALGLEFSKLGKQVLLFGDESFRGFARGNGLRGRGSRIDL